MNAFIVTFCVLAAVTISVCQTPAPRSDDWMKIADECKKKTNANDEDINSVIARQVPKTKEAACFLACTKKGSGAIGPDNKINLAVVIETLAPLKTNKEIYDKVVKIFQDCKALEIPETDECVAAKKFAACVIPKKEALMKPAA